VKIAYLRQRSDADRYFIEYIDCRSSGGFFQKYRFIFVHGQFLPLSTWRFADGWKVYHDSANRQRMPRRGSILNDPATVFSPTHYRPAQAAACRPCWRTGN
jgi:hypothetical protein